jgi:hypothetical protein
MMDFVILKKHLLIAAVINQMLEDIHNSKMKIVMMIYFIGQVENIMITQKTH